MRTITCLFIILLLIFDSESVKILRGKSYGQFRSPNYPSPYPNNVEKEWRIIVQSGFRIKIRFTTFDLEGPNTDGECAHDYVEITEGDKKIGKFCGNSILYPANAPKPRTRYYTDGNVATVRFISNSSISSTGFRGIYVEEDINECLQSEGRGQQIAQNSDAPTTCDHFCDNVPSSYVCSCRAGYTLHVNNHTCVVKSCGSPENLRNIKNTHIVDFSSKQFAYNEEITVECDDWYEMTSGASRWVCGDNNQWEMIADSLVAPNYDNNKPKCRPRCGQRLVKDPATQPLVSGGKLVTKLGGWPWMAFIDRKGRDGGRRGTNYCGGTLVDERTVVTAATCIANMEEDYPIDVWLGLKDRYNDNFNYTQKFEAVPHKRYWPDSYGVATEFDGDIAVIKLDRPANLSYYVHPICIPRSSAELQLPHHYYQNKKNAIVIGWGGTERQSFSQHLYKTRVGIYDRDTCAQRYEDALGGEYSRVTENMICAGFDHSTNDACMGDTGGPLMMKMPGAVTLKDIWYLSGIVSFGDMNVCGRSDVPGVYTDVGKYRRFIDALLER